MPSAKYINLCEESAFRAFMGELYTKNNLRLLPEIILGSGNIQNLPDRPLRQFLMNIFSPDSRPLVYLIVRGPAGVSSHTPVLRAAKN